MLSVTLNEFATVISDGMAISYKSASARAINLLRLLVGTKRTEGEAAVSEIGTPLSKVAVTEVSESITAEELSTPLKTTMTS